MDKSIESEIRVLQASIGGSSEAFEGLVCKYQSLVCAITYSALGDIEKSEELAQETFVRAWKNLKQLRDQSRFRSWLCSIAKSTIKNYFRKRKHDIIHKADMISNAAEISSDIPDPSHNLIAKEQQAVVDQALQNIPESYRQPLILFYRQEQSVRQVAEQLELSEDNVRTRLHRGRKMLKEQVATMVENTLASTAPGKAFTVVVMASVAGMALKGSGVATAASIATDSSTAGTATSVTAVMSTITAKIITAAAVLAIGVGAVVAYKQIAKPNQNPTPLPTAIVAEKEDDAKSINEQSKTIEIATSQAAETPDNSIATQIADVVDSPKNLSEETKPPVISIEPVSTENEEFRFVPKGVLSGLITDKDTGKPIVEAEIVVYGASMPNGKLVTDVNGFYSLEKIKNSKPYMIVIDSKDYIGKPDIDDNYKISIEKDDQQIAHFQLKKACIADLWVKDEQGNPIKGAKINVVDLATNRSTAASRSGIIEPTDKDGYTLIGGHPASKAGYMVMITHESRTGKLITSSEGSRYHETKPGFAPAHVILKNTDPEIIPAFDVTMKKGKPIKGYIEYSDGVPASDLKIVSIPYWWSMTNLSGPRTEVAPDGSFTLSNIAPEKYCISAFYPVNGSYKAIKTIDFTQHDGDLIFTLPEPSPQSLLTIKGIVKVIRNAPVGNLYIRVHSYNTTTNTHGSNTSIFKYDENDQAAFKINRLKKGNYRLTFQSEHFEKVVLENIKPPVDDLYIEMEQVVKPEIVAMVVDKATGKPVTNMRARLIKNFRKSGNSYGVSEKWLERSNPQGRAFFTVTHGVYQIQIMADGFAVGVSEEIDTENLKPVMVELTKGGTIKGRIINSFGKPVAGAEISGLLYAGGNRANNSNDFSIKTKSIASDANGNFVLENLPEGINAIKANHNDYSPVIVRDIDVVNGKVSEEITVELEEGAIIEGYVFDNNGNAVADAKLDYDQNRERVITGQSTNFVVTDPNGYYRIEGLGENSYFIARNRGSFTEGVSSRTITPVCGEVTRGDFGGDGNIVMGTIVVDDVPSSNIKLALRSNKFDRFVCYTTTDADGNFVFTGIVRGGYNIRSVEDFNTMFSSVDVVDRDIDLGVIGNNFVDFEIVIESHEDWKQLQWVVIILPPTQVSGKQRDEIDKQNRLWRFNNVAPGKYDLIIMNDKATGFTTKIDIAEEQIEPLKIKPPKLDITLTGIFYRSVSNKSTPQYLLLRNSAKTVSAYLVPQKDGVPDANGQFEVKLPAGQYQISYSDGKEGKLLKEFEIISGQHMELEIDLDTTLE